jgi:hypothetical protein
VLRGVEKLRDAMESVSLVSGAILVAVASSAVTFAWLRMPSRNARLLLGVASPLIIAWSLYWSPVWLGAESSEYSAWVLVCVVPWYVAGLVASALTAYVLRRCNRGRRT